VNVDDPHAPATPALSASADEGSSYDPGEAALAGYAEIAAQAKRIVWPCCILGVIAVIASVLLLKEPWAGIGVCIGLGLGMVNARLLQQSVLRRFQAATGQTVSGSAFLFSGLTRLAVITGVAVVLTLVERPLGIGVVVGLAVYQVVLLGASAVVMYRQVRA
jgi:hypothetical protein